MDGNEGGNSLYDPIDIISNITEYIPYVIGRRQTLVDEIKILDQRQTDLLHEIENGEFDEDGFAAKAKELQELRKERRRLKDEYAILEPLFTYLYNNKKMEIDLFKIRTNMERIKQIKDNWIYTPRVTEESTALEGVI